MLELLDDSQRVQIVVETGAVGAHEFVKLALARVAEGGMPDIVDECQRFRQFAIEAEGGRNRAGDLRDFQGVREAVAEVIRIARGENLRFCFQPAKCARVDDTVPVARELAAIGVARFGVAAAARKFFAHGQGREWRGVGDNPLRLVPTGSGSYDFGASKSRPRSARSETAELVG